VRIIVLLTYLFLEISLLVCISISPSVGVISHYDVNDLRSSYVMRKARPHQRVKIASLLLSYYAQTTVFRCVSHDSSHLIASRRLGKTDLRYTKIVINHDDVKLALFAITYTVSKNTECEAVPLTRSVLLTSSFYIKIVSLTSYRFIHFRRFTKTVTPTATYQRNVVATRYFIHFIYFFCGVSMDHL